MLVWSEVLQWKHSSKLTWTLNFLRHRFWWPSIVWDTRAFITPCPVCALGKSSHQPPAGLLNPFQIPQWSCSHIAGGFVTGLPPLDGNTTILVVDRFSKVVHFIPLSEFSPGQPRQPSSLFPDGHCVWLRAPVYVPSLEGLLQRPWGLGESLLWLPPTVQQASRKNKPVFGECPPLHDHAPSDTVESFPVLGRVRPQLFGLGLHGDVSFYGLHWISATSVWIPGGKGAFFTGQPTALQGVGAGQLCSPTYFLTVPEAGQPLTMF